MIRRLDGRSEGPVCAGHEIMIYSPEADCRLDVGMKEGANCDPDYKTWATYFYVRPVQDFYGASEPIQYEQEVGFFSPDEPFRMDIGGVATKDMDSHNLFTRFKVELETYAA